jgi:hypothetical protein
MLTRPPPNTKRNGSGSPGRNARAQVFCAIGVCSIGMRCVECERESEDAEGWRAYLVGDPDDDGDEAPAVIVYCRLCAEREFGLQRPRAR